MIAVSKVEHKGKLKDESISDKNVTNSITEILLVKVLTIMNKINLQ